MPFDVFFRYLLQISLAFRISVDLIHDHSHERETGMSRLSLSDADKEARNWLADKARSLGCKVTVDKMGNMFAVRSGRQDGPPTCAGSHLDTQPNGGRYVRCADQQFQRDD